MKPITDSRFDFRAGVNYSATQDGVAPNELVLCTNARVNPGGDVQRRAATSKLGDIAAALPATPINGLFSWKEPLVGLRYLATANGSLYESSDLITWSSVGSLSFATAEPAHFVEMISGNTTIVYLAHGGILWSWNGTTLTDLSVVGSTPEATILAVYGNRLFANDTSEPRTLYWSALGNGSDFTVSGLSGGGSVQLELTEGDQISAFAVLGSSLLIASNKTIARFTGTADDIQILQDTEGVSTDLGPMSVSGFNGQGAFRRVEQAVFMLTNRGPYLVTEGGIVALTSKLQTSDTSIKWESNRTAYIGYNEDRNEVWFIYENINDTATTGGYGRTVLVFSLITKTFSGPFTLPAFVSAVATLPSPQTGRKLLYAGCTDDFIRLVDDPSQSQDDAATDYTHTIRFAPFIFDSAGPQTTKKIRHIFLQLQRKDTDTVPTVKIYPDNNAGETAVLVSDSGIINAPTNLRYDVDSEGKRFVVEVSGSYSASADGDNPQIIGCIVQGNDMGRY